MNVNRLLLLTILIGVSVTFLFFYIFSFSRRNIVYVDSNKLLSGYKSMVAARTEFEAKQVAWKSNVDTLTNDVKTAIAKYEKTAMNGSVKEKQLAKDFITEKQKQLYEYQNAIRQNSSQEEQRLTQNVLSTVNIFLERYGKKNGYKLILVASNGNIAYADESMDITEKVVEELNKEYAVPAK